MSGFDEFLRELAGLFSIGPDTAKNGPDAGPPGKADPQTQPGGDGKEHRVEYLRPADGVDYGDRQPEPDYDSYEPDCDRDGSGPDFSDFF